MPEAPTERHSPEEAVERMLLLPLKTSVGDPCGGLALRLGGNAVEWEPAPVPRNGLGTIAGQWELSATGPPNGRGPSIAPPRHGPAALRRAEAARWLQEQLAAGPVPVGTRKDASTTPGTGAGTLRAAAKSAGMAWTTVRRAFKELSGIGEKCRRTRKQTWRLPDPAVKSADKDV